MSSPDDSLARRALQRIGTRLSDRYRISHLLGMGGMAAVYAGVHRNGHPVAIKILHERLSDDPHIERLFRREALLANKIKHANLVPVLDDDVADDGSTFLVMPLLSGETARGRAQRNEGKLPLEEVLVIAHALLDVLSAAHALQIVHRDIKPDNIFITQAGEIRVLDFGIARFFETNELPSATQSSRRMGTPGFMAPEQIFEDLREVDAQSDLWAVGATMFTLLSGRLVHEAASPNEALVATLTRQARALADVAPDLPAAICDLVDRALSFEKRSRWPSAAAMNLALAEACESVLGTPPSDLPKLAPKSLPSLDIGDAITEPPPRVQILDRPLPKEPSPAVAEGPVGPTLASPDAIGPAIRSKRTGTAASATGWRWLAGATVLLIGGAATWGLRDPAKQRVPPSPLAAPSSVLACPVFEASGVPEPAGWLGAAAAATVCERAQVILGGSASRTLVPAELLSLPRLPVDHYPEDPFGQPDARSRSLDAARQRATAYIDGSVAKSDTGFRTTLTLQRADGSEIARSDGQGRALYEAVRDAMRPLISPDRIPMAPALDATYAQWSRAEDVESALALLDVELAIHQNVGKVAEECRALDTKTAKIGEMAATGPWVCAYTVGVTAPPTAFPSLDASLPAASLAARVRLRGMAFGTESPEMATRLREHLRREQTPLGRSVLAATVSCELQGADPRQASDFAHLAVQADPKNRLGEFCAPWGQLLSVTRETASVWGVIHARQAWQPWYGAAWVEPAFRSDNPTKAVAYSRRAYALAPFNAWGADVLADNLLALGEREEVRSMAIAMSMGDHPVQKVESDLLFVKVDASEARFGAALTRAIRSMEIAPGDAGWVRAQRFDMAWRALEIADVLGRSVEVADHIVERLLAPIPSPLDGNFVTAPLRIPAICVRASKNVSKRCFDRFRALLPRLGGGVLQDTSAFTEGAERYARGEYLDAARAWRPLLRDPGLFAKVIPDAMEATFERSGDHELVQRLEVATLASGAGQYNGATLADVRAARRAAARDDVKRARELAHKVIEAWAVSDEPVPAVAVMRELMTRFR